MAEYYVDFDDNLVAEEKSELSEIRKRMWTRLLRGEYRQRRKDKESLTQVNIAAKMADLDDYDRRILNYASSLLREIGEGTEAIEGGTFALNYSSTRDRAAIVGAVFDALFATDAPTLGADNANFVTGQLDDPSRVIFCSCCNHPYERCTKNRLKEIC